MAPPSTTYLYRCTEDKLEQHLQQIVDAGDVVEHVMFKGGRDYVLVVRRGDQAPVVRLHDDTIAALARQIAAAIGAGTVAGRRHR